MTPNQILAQRIYDMPYHTRAKAFAAIPKADRWIVVELVRKHGKAAQLTASRKNSSIQTLRQYANT